MPALVWFRDDLRLADHAALDAAARSPGGIVALYVLDDESSRPLGGAARWWLHESLTSLAARLAAHGVPLILRRGAAHAVISQVAAECGATHVFWNRRYGPERHIDAQIKEHLQATGVVAQSFHGGLLFDPRVITTGSGTPFRVYSPFWRACLAAPAPARPLPEPRILTPAPRQPASEPLAQWHLQPACPNWATEIAERWHPGEPHAVARLREFLHDDAARYATHRDIPSATYGSELSPHLRFGEMSPRTVWHAALASGADVGMFLSELGWREFAWHTTFHTYALHERGLDRRFDHFPWRDPGPQDSPDDAAGYASASAAPFREAPHADHTEGIRRSASATLADTKPERPSKVAVEKEFVRAVIPVDDDAAARDDLLAWQRGETGFPIVDAGMRELWRTGFMHNRVRMITASFLTKNLLIDWRIGEAWFWDTLVDADPASNPFNWQWVAGCGVDAAPYFRVFNPLTQQKKFDPEGRYVNRWAPQALFTPEIVDLGSSRARALDAFDRIKLLRR